MYVQEKIIKKGERKNGLKNGVKRLKNTYFWVVKSKKKFLGKGGGGFCYLEPHRQLYERFEGGGGIEMHNK